MTPPPPPPFKATEGDCELCTQAVLMLKANVFAPISGAYQHTLSGSVNFFLKRRFSAAGCELGRELQIHTDLKISTSVVEGTLIRQNLQAGISKNEIACVWGRFTFQKCPC
jgi:hypothetical protein